MMGAATIRMATVKETLRLIESAGEERFAAGLCGMDRFLLQIACKANESLRSSISGCFWSESQWRFSAVQLFVKRPSLSLRHTPQKIEMLAVIIGDLAAVDEDRDEGFLLISEHGHIPVGLKAGHSGVGQKTGF